MIYAVTVHDLSTSSYTPAGSSTGKSSALGKVLFHKNTANSPLRVRVYPGSSSTPRGIAVDQTEEQWQHFLQVVAAKGAVSPLAIKAADHIVNNLRSFSTAIDLPRAMPSADRGLLMTWDAVAHHLELEIGPTGRYEWFYRNRRTGEFTGGENYPYTVMPLELLVLFRAAAERVP
jgi:hypothetical protein